MNRFFRFLLGAAVVVVFLGLFAILARLPEVVTDWHNSQSATTPTSTMGVLSLPSLDESVQPPVGLRSLLDGWTFENHWGEDDWRVDTILAGYGAKDVVNDASGVAPDIDLEATNSGKTLWVRYHGHEQFIRKDDPGFFRRVTEVVIDMARVKLTEARADLARQAGEKSLE